MLTRCSSDDLKVIDHYRIQGKDGKITVDEESFFNSLEELIKARRACVRVVVTRHSIMRGMRTGSAPDSPGRSSRRRALSSCAVPPAPPTLTSP